MKNTGNSAPEKRGYSAPLIAIIRMGEADVIRTSGGDGALSWGDDWGDWSPSRPDTTIGED